jgi:hypothetical protein
MKKYTVYKNYFEEKERNDNEDEEDDDGGNVCEDDESISEEEDEDKYSSSLSNSIFNKRSFWTNQVYFFSVFVFTNFMK